jgi:hypothetical protein
MRDICQDTRSCDRNFPHYMECHGCYLIQGSANPSYYATHAAIYAIQWNRNSRIKQPLGLDIDRLGSFEYSHILIFK